MQVLYGFVAGLLVAFVVYLERNRIIKTLRDKIEGIEAARKAER